MQSDLFWAAFCEVSSLAWGALLQVAPPKPVRIFHFDQGKAGEMRVPQLGTCSELQGGSVRESPFKPCASQGFLPCPLFAQGVGLGSWECCASEGEESLQT